MKGQNKNLLYLEEIRQHINRLPTIDPNTRTLLITGFPNVGKSSFINKVSLRDFFFNNICGNVIIASFIKIVWSAVKLIGWTYNLFNAKSEG